jgi:hypothetical protein
MRLHVSCPQKPEFGFLFGLYSPAVTFSRFSFSLFAFFCVMFGTSFAEVAVEEPIPVGPESFQFLGARNYL